MTGKETLSNQAKNLRQKAEEKAIKKADMRISTIPVGDMDGIATAAVSRQECQVPVDFLTTHSDKTTRDWAQPVESFEDRAQHTQIETALYKRSSKKRLREIKAQWRYLRRRPLKKPGNGDIQTMINAL